MAMATRESGVTDDARQVIDLTGELALKIAAHIDVEGWQRRLCRG